MVAEAEDVGGRVQPAELDELGDGLLAQPLDVERAARDEMAQPLEALRRADQAAGAADVDLAFLGDRLGLRIRGNGRGRRKAARGSSRVRFSTTCGMTSPARWMRTRSPIAQAEPRDLVAVVERDVGDDHAADADRRQPPDRRQLAGAADLDVDRFERRLGLLGGELVREPPARRPRRPGRAAPASRAGRPCRRRRRCRTAGRRAPSRSRDNGRASPRPSSQRTSRSVTGMPKLSIRFIASQLRRRRAAR